MERQKFIHRGYEFEDHGTKCHCECCNFGRHGATSVVSLTLGKSHDSPCWFQSFGGRKDLPADRISAADRIIDAEVGKNPKGVLSALERMDKSDATS